MRTERHDALPTGWRLLRGASTAPVGWAWACNGLSRFDPGYRHALVIIGVRHGQE